MIFGLDASWNMSSACENTGKIFSRLFLTADHAAGRTPNILWSAGHFEPSKWALYTSSLVNVEGQQFTNRKRTMRFFNLITESVDHVRLVEIYCYGGVYREFTGRTCVQDAKRYLNLVCPDPVFRVLNFIDNRPATPDYC